jgi:tetratricopeptide (TPR) repeat protein
VADYQDTPEEMRSKAQAFFTRAKSVAASGQHDYAIEMFLQGMGLDPEAVEAHGELREVSMNRKLNGGKPLGMMERMKVKAIKDPKTAMLAHERILAYDPGDMDAMVGMLTSANKGGFWDTALWIGPILLRANIDSPKPDIKKYLILKDVYKDLKKYDRAVEACQYAANMRPNDLELTGELKNLSAMETMKRGNYTEGEFRRSMKDRDQQEKLLEDERDYKSTSILERRISDAETDYREHPNEAGKLTKLIDALLATEQPEHENRAIELLQENFDRTKQYRFRRAIGQINMKIWNRMERTRREEAKTKPNDETVQEEYKQFMRDKLEFELNEYRDWAENYPTDLTFRFEMAKRLFALGRYDEAIPEFQLATNDPKHRAESSIWLGKSFYEAGFYEEAAQILESSINEYVGRNDEKSKLLFYWRGRALEAMNDIEAALKHFSQVAQWQFGYEDVQTRIKKLREEQRNRSK